jgi:Spy/CpxP family protein refolding chaperone
MFCRFTCLLSIFAICLPVLGSLAPAQENPPAGQVPAGPDARLRLPLQRALEGGQGLGAEILRQLNLPAAQKALAFSDEQRKKLEDITFNIRRSAIQQQATLQVQRLELQRLMGADTPDRAAIDKKVQEIAQTQSSLLRARVTALLDLRGLLTKEQRDKIREFVRQRLQQAGPGAQQARPRPKINPPPLAPQASPPQPPAPPKPPGQ